MNRQRMGERRDRAALIGASTPNENEAAAARAAYDRLNLRLAEHTVEPYGTEPRCPQCLAVLGYMSAAGWLCSDCGVTYDHELNVEHLP